VQRPDLAVQVVPRQRLQQRIRHRAVPRQDIHRAGPENLHHSKSANLLSLFKPPIRGVHFHRAALVQSVAVHSQTFSSQQGQARRRKGAGGVR